MKQENEPLDLVKLFYSQDINVKSLESEFEIELQRPKIFLPTV